MTWRNWPVLFAALLLVSPARAQINPPNYEELRLDGIFPAGGRQGDTVTVTLFGTGKNCNFSDAREIIIDGPPGISIRDIKNVSAREVSAAFVIAEDAVPGRRCVRVLSERSGLTNMIYFSVGRLPEVCEQDSNDSLETAQPVTLPVVVNGRVNPGADRDCFLFRLNNGQRLTAAVLAHSIDSHGQGGNFGFVDASLELLDESGRIVAEAEDTFALDPLIEYVAPSDGTYVARVRLEGFAGFSEAVYRLILGEVPLATSVFPPGGRRGTVVEVELAGPNIPAGKRQNVTVPDDDFPWQTIIPDDERAADLELPFVRGDFPERLEVEPNDKADMATRLDVPMTNNGRIDALGDVDWYSLRLNTGQAVCLEVAAQRFLRSPIDTLIQVFDSGGKMLAENDDGFPHDNVSMHDFRPMDSRLLFTAPSDGDFFVRVSDQSGNGGPRAVYRLTAKPGEPDFELYLYPDGVPVWGPGSTAAFLVKIVRFDGMDGDIRVDVDGLPREWVASSALSPSSKSTPSQVPSLYHFMTLTAPADATPGQAFPFRVVGRAEVNGRTVERVARPLTWYYTSDIGLFRITPQARVAVARRQSPWLSTPVDKVSAAPGGIVLVPIQVHDGDQLEQIELVADLASSGVGTALISPKQVAVSAGRAELSLNVPESMRPGHYDFTVGLRWNADIRGGMPGPCTRLIRLEVTPPPVATGK